MMRGRLGWFWLGLLTLVVWAPGGGIQAAGPAETGFRFQTASFPLCPPSPLQREWTETMDAVLARTQGQWRVMLVDARAGCVLYQHESTRPGHVASAIKVPVAMLTLAALQQRVPRGMSLETYLATRGPSRTYAQLLRAMLVHSEEAATQTLLEFLLARRVPLRAMLAQWGASHTDVLTRRSTAADLARLLVHLYWGTGLSSEARRGMLTWMAEYTPNDALRLGRLAPYLPPGARLYNKRATLVKEQLIVGDIGLLVFSWRGQERAYVMVLLGYGGTKSVPYETLEAELEQMVQALGQALWQSLVTEPWFAWGRWAW